MNFNRMLWQKILGIILLIWIIFTDSKLNMFQSVFNIIGIFCLFIGIIGRIYSTLYIGGMKNEGKDGKSFINDGIYSICRNPLYLFSFIAFIGILFIKGQMLLLIFSIICYLIIYHLTILGEEAFLSEKFGDDYKEFLKTTPRFFPKFSSFKYSDKVEFRPLFLHKELRRAFVWLFAALIIYIITILQDNGFIKVFFHIY